MIYVIATIETVATRRDHLLQQFARIVPLVRQEAGCLLYAPSIDVDTSIDNQRDLRENVITVVEQWESLETLEGHLMAPHMIEFREVVKEDIRSVDLQIVEPA